MKKKIFALSITISTVTLTVFPDFTNTVKKVAFLKIDSAKYQAVKLDNTKDAMLNPEQGGVNQMPPPQPWIPPVEEGVNNKMPPAKIPKSPGYGNYTPVNLPPSAPWVTPSIKDNGQLRTPYYPIR